MVWRSAAGAGLRSRVAAASRSGWALVVVAWRLAQRRTREPPRLLALTQAAWG